MLDGYETTLELIQLLRSYYYASCSSFAEQEEF